MNETNVSLREKSAWASLVTTLAVFGPYFIYVFRWMHREEVSAGAVLGVLTGAVIIHIILISIASGLVAVLSKKEPVDERDTLIDSKALRNAYWMVSISLAIAACSLVINATDGVAAERAWLYAPAFVSQVFLVIFVAGEVTRFLTRVICYRRGS